MNRVIIGLTFILASLGAQAALLGRAPTTLGGTDYQAYYDTGLNITWQANANLPLTQSFGLTRSTSTVPPAGQIGADGRMNWATANTWLAGMNQAIYLGYSDWRLPNDKQPDPTCPSQYDPGGGLPIQGFGPGCAGSDMGHLFQVDGVTYFAPAPFANIVSGYYWFGTTHVTRPQYAIAFAPTIGDQIGHEKITSLFVWAVRDGDIAPVPVPAAAWLLSSALGILTALKKLRRI